MKTSTLFFFFFLQLLWVKENLKDSWAMVFRWMDLSDWLSYRYLDQLVLNYMITFLMSGHHAFPESQTVDCINKFALILCIPEQQGMILGVCAPQCANGHILVMHTCNR